MQQVDTCTHALAQHARHYSPRSHSLSTGAITYSHWVFCGSIVLTTHLNTTLIRTPLNRTPYVHNYLVAKDTAHTILYNRHSHTQSYWLICGSIVLTNSVNATFTRIPLSRTTFTTNYFVAKDYCAYNTVPRSTPTRTFSAVDNHNTHSTYLLPK